MEFVCVYGDRHNKSIALSILHTTQKSSSLKHSSFSNRVLGIYGKKKERKRKLTKKPKTAVLGKAFLSRLDFGWRLGAWISGGFPSVPSLCLNYWYKQCSLCQAPAFLLGVWSSLVHASESRRCGFNTWVRKVLWSRKWQSTPVCLPEKFHGQRSLAGYSPWGHKELDTTE